MLKKIKALPKTTFYCRQKKETKCYCGLLCLYYVSFHECGCQISRVQNPESELRCYMNTLSAWCFAYFKQPCAHTRSSLQKHRRRWSENRQTSWSLASKWKCYSILSSRLYCLRLWSLNKCTYSTAVVLIEKYFTVIIFLVCFTSFHNVDRESAYVFGINLYNKMPIINQYTRWGKINHVWVHILLICAYCWKCNTWNAKVNFSNDNNLYDYNFEQK